MEAHNRIHPAGTTPLHWVASVGSLRAAELLISSGARIDSRDSMDLTQLHLARTREIAATLLAHGAEVNARNYYERTPLHCATAETENWWSSWYQEEQT